MIVNVQLLFLKNYYIQNILSISQISQKFTTIGIKMKNTNNDLISISKEDEVNENSDCKRNNYRETFLTCTLVELNRDTLGPVQTSIN